MKIWPMSKTLLTVILLTGMIWVYAERQVTRSDQVSVSIRLDDYLAEEHPELLVRFLDDSGEPISSDEVMVNLTIMGPTGRLQAYSNHYLLPQLPILTLDNLNYDPAESSGPATTRINVVTDLFDSQLPLQNTDTFFQLTQADPEQLTVEVVPLQQRSLPVQVYDSLGKKISGVTIDPAEIDAWVLPWQNQLEYEVILSPSQLLQAEDHWLTVEARGNAVRPKQLDVNVRLEEALAQNTEERLITTLHLGIVMPPSMVGKYRVIINEDPQAFDPIRCSGPAATLNAYEQARYHLLLEVDPSDTVDKIHDRTLRYYLPEQKDFKILDDRRRVVKFRLEPVEQTAVPQG